MRRIFLFCLFSQALALFSQSSVSPVLRCWLRADSTERDAPYWRDVSGHARHAYPANRTFAPAGHPMNFNKSFRIPGGEHFVVPSLLCDHSSATVIVVYESDDSLGEQGLWSLHFSQNERLGLTTQSILSPRGRFSYQEENSRFRVIHSIHQGWKKEWGVPPADTAFRLCRADSLDYQGRIAECLYFDGRMEDSLLVQYISYLALKYGVTLYHTDYLDSRGRVIWDYTAHPEFSFSIGGLGRDTVYGLCQKQTYLNEEGMIIGVGTFGDWNTENPALMEHGEYLIWGLDSGRLSEPSTAYWEDGTPYTRYGNGLLQVTGEHLPLQPSFIRVDASEWEGDLMSYYLLVDRSGHGDFLPLFTEGFPADSIDEHGWLYFHHVLWDSDRNGRDRFCFASFDSDTLSANNAPKSLAVNGDGEGNEHGHTHGSSLPEGGEPRYRLYPNPAQEEFFLDIDYPEAGDVTVRIRTVEGKLLKEFTGRDSLSYHFSGKIKVKGQYLVEIFSPRERKTMKLVIR